MFEYQHPTESRFIWICAAQLLPGESRLFKWRTRGRWIQRTVTTVHYGEMTVKHWRSAVHYVPPLPCSGSGEDGVGSVMCNAAHQKVGLLWREMAICVAGNGVGLSDIFTALQARVTFSRRKRAIIKEERKGNGWGGGRARGEREVIGWERLKWLETEFRWRETNKDGQEQTEPCWRSWRGLTGGSLPFTPWQGERSGK